VSKRTRDDIATFLFGMAFGWLCSSVLFAVMT
jgi:hypothetical protein